MVLGRGDRGVAVAEVQEKLNLCRVPDDDGRSLLVDGDFGPKTEQAVRRFQAWLGLEVDGWVGPITQRALGVALLQKYGTETPTVPDVQPEPVGSLGGGILKVGLYMQSLGVREIGSTNRGGTYGPEWWSGVSAMLDTWVKGANPWCCAFTSMCTAVAYWREKHGRDPSQAEVRSLKGVVLSTNPLYVPTQTSFAKAKEWIVPASALRPGDVFCMSDGSHTGLVRSVSGSTIQTCEGNAGNAVTGLARGVSGKVFYRVGA